MFCLFGKRDYIFSSSHYRNILSNFSISVMIITVFGLKKKETESKSGCVFLTFDARCYPWGVMMKISWGWRWKKISCVASSLHQRLWSASAGHRCERIAGRCCCRRCTWSWGFSSAGGCQKRRTSGGDNPSAFSPSSPSRGGLKMPHGPSERIHTLY